MPSCHRERETRDVLTTIDVLRDVCCGQVKSGPSPPGRIEV